MRKLKTYSVIPAMKGTPFTALLRYTLGVIPFWSDTVTLPFYTNIFGCTRIKKGKCVFEQHCLTATPGARRHTTLWQRGAVRDVCRQWNEAPDSLGSRIM